MTDRKKKGIGYLISGSLFVGLGIVLTTMSVTPDWVTMAISAIGIVANIFGFTVVYPDVEKPK